MYTRRFLFLLILLLVAGSELVSLLADSSSVRGEVGGRADAEMRLERDLAVQVSPPIIVARVRYPDGSSVLYGAPSLSSIPSEVSVPIGSTVSLEISGRVNQRGTYSTSAIVGVNPPYRGYLSTYAAAECNENSGGFRAMASVTIHRYKEGMRIRLTVEFYSWKSGAARSETVSRSLNVEMLPGPQQVHPAVSSSESETPKKGSETHQGETVHWLTKTTEARELEVEPRSMTVIAGEVAIFSINTSLKSPKFRIDGLPTGFRYTVTKEGGLYHLNIMTHPLSYGTFKMEVTVMSGNEVERASISLTVRKALSTTSTFSSRDTSLSTSSSREALTGEQQETPRGTTTFMVTTVVISKGDRTLLTALGTIAILASLLIILIVRRRFAS